MIEQVIKKFHETRQGRGNLADLIAEDCVFYSPVVYTPQKGKDLTMLYLASAGNVFSQSDADPAGLAHDAFPSASLFDHIFGATGHVSTAQAFEVAAQVVGHPLGGLFSKTFILFAVS